ncbi:MAG: N-formylglutamate deformylase [Geminicoccaceae bacterium]
MSFVEVEERSGPLILGLPHTGTFVQDDLVTRMTKAGQGLEDTDWHVHELYAFAQDFGASTVRTTVSRYVIDCNRDPSGASLYTGQATTELCPTTTFAGERLWEVPGYPDPAEIERRREVYFVPYHEALSRAVERTRAAHGYALLWDCHSIRSRIPRLFDGRLPDLNLGTVKGTSCAAGLRDTLAAALAGTDHVVDGRFIGGWTTRHYGRPDRHVHAVQMELAQSTHLAAEAPPWTLDPTKTARLVPVLRRCLDTMLAFGRTTYGG